MNEEKCKNWGPEDDECFCSECTDKAMWAPNKDGVCPGDIMMSSEEE